jgi:hypothetical protein
MKSGVGVLKKRFNGKTYSVSYHADLRHTMRIDAEKRLSAEVLEEAEPYSLSGGYERGFVNLEEEVVFLVSGDKITTTIPLEGLEFSEDDPECSGCGARVQETCRKPRKCRFCGNRVRGDGGGR